CSAYRNPALLAQMAATVDEISDGRLVLGLGAGWHEPEFDALGLPFDRRVSRFEEAIQIIRGLLRDGQIDFKGDFYEARDSEIILRGPREEGPPILVGSIGPRMLRIAARHADMWNAFTYMYNNDPAELPSVQRLVDDACNEVGRDPKSMAHTASVYVSMSGARGISTITEAPIAGSPQDIAARLHAFSRHGISHLMIVPDPCTPEGLEEFASVLEILDSGDLAM
ncbi:MAG: LLM class flavin-dependent oxidoreductase, partial [Chloroflexota bacterium]